MDNVIDLGCDKACTYMRQSVICPIDTVAQRAPLRPSCAKVSAAIHAIEAPLRQFLATNRPKAPKVPRAPIRGPATMLRCSASALIVSPTRSDVWYDALFDKIQYRTPALEVFQ